MLAPALAVFATALLHEDVALLAAAFVMHEHGMSPALAFALIVGGIIGNSLVLYALGAATRHHAWVRRWLRSSRVRVIGQHVERRLIATVLLARIGQGLAMPTMVGCGWLGVSLARVACAVVLAAVVYVTPMLTLAYLFGERVIEWVAHAGGIGLAVIACVVALLVWRARCAARRAAAGA
jgi:membrane protein DedA with SNARE-associated domain